MENFLDSSILPGDSVPKHVHRKLFVILIIIVLVAVGILASLLYYSKGNDAVVDSLNPRSVDPSLNNLKQYQVSITDQEKASSLKDLSKYEVPISDNEKASSLNNLQKYSTK